MNRKAKWITLIGGLALMAAILSFGLLAKPALSPSPFPTPLASPSPAAVPPSIAPSATFAPLLQSSPSTQPKITWSPTSVEVILSPGEGTTRNFTLTGDQALQNVVIEAVPAIAGFLSMQPNTLVSVPANTPQAFAVNFNIPATATLGTHDGTIHVRIGAKTLPQTLKVVVNVWRSYLNSSLRVSLKTPPDFLTEDTPYIGPYQLPAEGFISGQSVHRPDSPALLNIALYRNDKRLTVRDWFNQQLRGKEFSGGPLEPVSDGVNSITDLLIGGVAGIEVNGEVMGYVQNRFFIPRDDKVLQLSTSFPASDPEPNDISKIISTLTLP